MKLNENQSQPLNVCIKPTPYIFPFRGGAWEEFRRDVFLMESSIENGDSPMNSDGPVQYRSELFRYAQRYVQPPEAAEDLVQEAYLRFGRGREPVAQPRPWLYTTVRNLALNFLRDQKPTVSWEVLENSSEGNDSASASEAPDQHLEHLQRLESIQQWLSTFPEREREIVRLKFEEDLSYREIGLRLQIKPSHVGYILSLAIKSLREMAGKEEL